MALLIFSLIRFALKVSKEYIGEEGFWGIFIAIGIVGQEAQGIGTPFRALEIAYFAA